MCNTGCTALFTKDTVTIWHNSTKILAGARDTCTGLWRLLLNQPVTDVTPSHAINSAYDTDSIPALIQFLHATAFSSVPSTWTNNINRGFFQSWPGLTAQMVCKHLPKSVATTKGHLDQTRANQQSTRIQIDNSNEVPLQEPNNQPTHNVFATIEQSEKYTDQTGQFPVTSSLGNKYVMILYDCDTNTILAHPFKNQTGVAILEVYKKLHEILKNKGFKPQTHWLNNEASNAMKKYEKLEGINIQLVPPHIHCHNSTLLVALGFISSQQSKATEQTKCDLNQLLDYCHMHPTATICYQAINMAMQLHSDAPFQSEVQAPSRAGGHFYLGNKADNNPDKLNGAILSTSTIMKHVMSSAAETECGALFLNAFQAILLQTTLNKMRHPQPPTPIQVDNSTTAGFANQQIKQYSSQLINMRFYWIQDCANQKQILVFW